MFEVTALPTESQSFPIFNVFTQNAILPNIVGSSKKEENYSPIFVLQTQTSVLGPDLPLLLVLVPYPWPQLA